MEDNRKRKWAPAEEPASPSVEGCAVVILILAAIGFVTLLGFMKHWIWKG